MFRNILGFAAFALICLNGAAVLFILTDVPVVYKTTDGRCVSVQYHDGLVEGCMNLPDRYEVVYVDSGRYNSYTYN